MPSAADPNLHLYSLISLILPLVSNPISTEAKTPSVTGLSGARFTKSKGVPLQVLKYVHSASFHMEICAQLRVRNNYLAASR